jgi:hypothetical protein
MKGMMGARDIVPLTAACRSAPQQYSGCTQSRIRLTRSHDSRSTDLLSTIRARGHAARREVSLPSPWLYRVVRHPLYLGFLLGFWMTPTMTLAHLFFAAMTTAYILIAIQLEERDLVAEHGTEYETYRQRVPMLVPVPRLSKEPAGDVTAAARPL